MPRDGSASDALRGLAERAARGPRPRGAGRYHYIHTSGSFLRAAPGRGSPAARGGSGLKGSVESVEREQWIASDGSGRLLVTQGGVRVQPSGDYPPGGMAALFLNAGDPAAVSAELRGRGRGGTTAAAMKAFAQVWHLQVVPPALQRLLLLDLAGYPGLSVEGASVTHVDWEERTRHLLVLDEGTGALRRAEAAALDAAPDAAGGALPAPAVTHSTEWLLAGYAESTAARPE